MSIDIESVHDDMLMSISDDYQKTPGFPAYDFTRAFALGVVELSEDVEIAEKRTDVYNLSGEDLDRRVFQHRGLTRKSGLKATAVIELVSGSGTITKGDVFQTKSGIAFQATQTVTVNDGDTFEVEALVSGTDSNVAAGTITMMPRTIQGITSFVNPEPASGGTEDESDSALIERYLDDLRYPNNGSNQQAYIAWATSQEGVGRAKVFPLHDGPNTVEVCITGDDMGAPDADVVSAVQDYIDPNHNGDGSGTAPIGAVCTVTAAAAVQVTVSATVLKSEGYDVETVTANITANIEEYLQDIAFKRLSYDTYQTYVSLSKIGSCIDDAEGVLDYSDLKLNGSTASIQLTDRQVAVLGEVNVT